MQSSKNCQLYSMANSADPDQTALKEQSDLGLHCLLIHVFIICWVIYGDVIFF